jgi:hypothetical protein
MNKPLTTAMNKEAYTNLLRRGTCEVVFRKVDGTTRTMRATLDQDYITDNGLTPTGGGSAVPDSQVRCIDVGINQWRSFNVDTVISFAVE